MEKNEAILKDLTDELYIIEANEKIPGNCKYQAKLLQVVQNQKQTSTRGLSKLFKFKISVKVKLTANMNIRDCPINGQTGMSAILNLLNVVFLMYI